jgi:hypothetical protein
MHLPNLYLHMRYSIVLGDGGEEKGGWDADTKKKYLQNRVIRLVSNAGNCLKHYTSSVYARTHTHTHTCNGNCVLHKIKHRQVGTRVN